MEVGLPELLKPHLSLTTLWFTQGEQITYTGCVLCQISGSYPDGKTQKQNPPYVKVNCKQLLLLQRAPFFKTPLRSGYNSGESTSQPHLLIECSQANAVVVTSTGMGLSFTMHITKIVYTFSLWSRDLCREQAMPTHFPPHTHMLKICDCH